MTLIFSTQKYNSEIEEFVALTILADRKTPKSAVALTARRFTNSTGLDIIFALVSLAESIQQWHPSDSFERDLPSRIHKSCAILGADLFAMEKLGISPAFCRDLIEYWGDDEFYFR